METPLNEKQRNKAILRLSLVSLLLVIFLAYHVIISIAAFKADYSKLSVPAEAQSEQDE